MPPTFSHKIVVMQKQQQVFNCDRTTAFTVIIENRMNSKSRYNTTIKSEWEIRVGLGRLSISQVFICHQVTGKNILYR